MRFWYFCTPKKRCRWRVMLNFMRQFMRLLYLLHMWAAKAQTSLHICAVSPQPLQLALKEWSNVDEGSGLTLPLLRRWFCCWSFFNVPPIGLWGLHVWSLLSYAFLGALSSFSVTLTRKREEHYVLLKLSSYYSWLCDCSSRCHGLVWSV